MTRWRQPLLVVAIFAVVGVLAGAVWEALWEPPSGVALRGEWLLDTTGLPQEFEGTGLYLLVSLVAGLVTGFVVAWVLDRDPLATLAATAVGAVLAGALMYLVGTWLGPPDPAEVARTAAERTPVPGGLGVRGVAAYLGFPLGAMLAVTVVDLAFTHPKDEAATPPARSQVHSAASH